jgi:transposase
MDTKQLCQSVSRSFSAEFKRGRVKEYEKGRLTVREICELYNVGTTNVYRWIHKYSSYPRRQIRIVEMADSSTKKIKELHDRIKELERAVGQKQMNIDYLEKMIELAKSQLGVDVKKNFDTSQSIGSKKSQNS